jgi:capsular polysaccharide transport system permease protein
MTARHPLKIFFAVERALFLREMDMKISVGKSGLFWTFFEPFLQVFIYIGLKAAILAHRQNAFATTTSYDPIVFLASGFIAFNLFRNILSSSTGAFAANKGLFVYKQVKPIDTLLARAMVHLFLTSVIILIFLGIGFVLHFDNLLPKNTLMVIIGYLWLVLFSIGIGLLAAVGNVFFISVGKVISISSLLLLLTSAVFFPIQAVPPGVRELLLYNPIVHFMEMIHGFYLVGLDDRYVDYTYMFYWTIVPLFVGLWLYRRLEKRIISL